MPMLACRPPTGGRRCCCWADALFGAELLLALLPDEVRVLWETSDEGSPYREGFGTCAPASMDDCKEVGGWTVR